MKLAISNIAWQAADDDAVYALMKKYGYGGLEIAPTRIIPDNPYGQLERARAWAEDVKALYGFEIPSMQSIWFGRSEKLFGSSREWETLASYTEAAVDFAAAIGCRNLVFGSPKNRALPEGEEDIQRRRGVEFFRRVGGYASKKGAIIGMEANPVIYNTNYINTTAEALALIDEVGLDGFGLNLDVGTMIQNNERIETLEGKAGYISHVHISEPHLAPIKNDAGRRRLHGELICFLKENDYDGYVSIEMGRTDDVALISETLAYVKELALA